MFRTGLLNFSDWQAEVIGLDVGYDTTNKYSELYLPPARYPPQGVCLKR